MRVLGGRNVASLIATATCLATVTSLTACADSEPEQYLVGVPEQSLGNAPMPERYADAFGRYLVRGLNGDGRKAEREPVPADNRMRQLRTGDITVSFGCTGELLELLDRNRAMDLRRDFKKQNQETTTSAKNAEAAGATEATGEATTGSAAAARSEEEWKTLVYDELLSTLPQEIGATVPGEATPCLDSTLPQHAVVIYAKRVVGRDELGRLNSVATGTTMAMLGA